MASEFLDLFGRHRAPKIIRPEADKDAISLDHHHSITRQLKKPVLCRASRWSDRRRQYHVREQDSPNKITHCDKIFGGDVGPLWKKYRRDPNWCPKCKKWCEIYWDKDS